MSYDPSHDITISGDPQDPTVTIPIDQEKLDYIMREPGKPIRKEGERRKVRWITGREGRSKYAPHAGTKELAKIVARDTSDLL